MGIKLGQLGSATAASTPDEYRDSMAHEIEREFNTLLGTEGLPTMPDDNSKDSRDRRMLFIAIARGIVKHLEQHRSAITLTLPSGGGTDSPAFTIDDRDW
jgi:hypothetical protein